MIDCLFLPADCAAELSADGMRAHDAKQKAEGKAANAA